MPTFTQVQTALMACMQAEPPKDYVLSKDSSKLATVFAEMDYHKQNERPIEDFTPGQAAAFERWRNKSST
jgi:hypothetical protein